MMKRDAGFYSAIALILFVPCLGLIIGSGLLDDLDLAISQSLVLRGETASAWFAHILQAVTWLGHFGPRLCVSIIFALLIYQGRGKIAALAFVVTPLLSSGYSSLLKWLFDFPRPSIIPHLDDVSSASFPSGHATGAMVLYGLLVIAIPHGKRLIPIIFAVVMIMLTCWSRLALGVHWASDILGGLMAGLGFALLARPFITGEIRR